MSVKGNRTGVSVGKTCIVSAVMAQVNLLTLCSNCQTKNINWRLYRNPALPIFYRNIWKKNLGSLSCIAATISSLKSAFGTRRELVLLALIAVLAVCSPDALLQKFLPNNYEWLGPIVSGISHNNLISQSLISPPIRVSPREQRAAVWASLSTLQSFDWLTVNTEWKY